MFLAHFVGDVHQPLHVGFEDDEGGNTITVHWYRRKANLHHVCACTSDITSIPNFRCTQQVVSLRVRILCVARCGMSAS